MKYRFSRAVTKNIDYVRLVLKTEDPQLYRAGDVIDYSDVDTGALDELVTEFFETEKRKAQAFSAWMASDEGKEAVKGAVDASLKKIRMKARELFLWMEETEDADELEALNQTFTELTDKALMTERAFTFQNPWYAYYRDLEKSVRAVEMVVVRGTITDPGWFENPLYPVDKNYARFGMKGAKANVKMERRPQGRGSQNGKAGRPKELVAPDYVEPMLSILSYEPIGFFTEYRDLLPQEWLDSSF